MTATTTSTTKPTALCLTVVGSGTHAAPAAASTVSVDMERTSVGFHCSMEVSCCGHLACGSRASSLQCSDVIASLSLSLSPSLPISSSFTAQNKCSNQCSENRHQSNECAMYRVAQNSHNFCIFNFTEY